jgi:predicted lysophospholipase L1 biosynthesis ABC-type transport system permease subunit
VGRTLALVNTYASTSEKPELYTVVGIASEVSPILHERPSRPFVYLPLSQQWRPYSGMVIVRGAGDSRALIPSVKDAVARADGFADVFRSQTMTEMLGEIMYPRRIAGGVLAISGLVALFLATLGVYGVVSYAVAQRTGEIGVRMALGADRRDIRRLVLRDGLVIAAWASVVGVALGGAAIRLTSSRYLPLPQLDIATVLATPLLFAAVILLACYMPARRAGLVDPLRVLRDL